MAYIALKPCNFAGQAYKIGDIIPADVVLPGAAKSLTKMGRIAVAEGTETEPKQEEPKDLTIGILVKTEDGPLATWLSGTGLQAVFDVLTGNVKDAETIIKGIAEDDALILIHATDNRKTVKELAKTRAAELAQEAEGGDL